MLALKLRLETFVHDALFREPEAFVVDAIPNHVDALAGQLEIFLDIISGGAADGGNARGMAREPFDHDAPVDHPREIVFSGHRECGAIVDGGQLRAGETRHDAPVARDVDEVEFFAPGDSRQEELVPGDIADGGTVALGHGQPLAPIEPRRK